MKNEKKPQIRFKGFDDDWEQRKLGDEAIEMMAGGDIDKEKVVEDGKYPIYANALTNDGIVGYYNDYFRVKAPAVTVTGRGEVGHAQARMTDFTPVVRLLAIRSNHDCYFLENAINNHKVIVESTGVPQLTVPQLASYNIFFPSKLEEEVKIGEYFNNLDNLITLHQRKCDKLEQIKKSMLEKMFPKNGTKKPEIRFKGFNCDWEQRKVSELCSISTGKSNTQDKVEDGMYPFYVRSPIVERSTKYLYDEEAVITVGDGVGTGKVFHYVNGKYDLHQRCYRMYDFTNELNAHYFYHTFSKLFYKRVMAMTAKTSVDSVRLEMISDMKIPCPNIKEQEKIGAYFDNLDNLITLHQRELKRLEYIKKSMLERMFV